MIYDINLAASEIKVLPDSQEQEILQNIRTILLTQVGSVPLYREFGVNADMLDAPLNIAQNRFTAEVAKAIARWEPRAKLKGIVWQESAAVEGKLEPLISVEI